MSKANIPQQAVFVYGAKAGAGGLGVQSANALASIASGRAHVHAFGPGQVAAWPLPEDDFNISWHQSPQFIPSWATRYTSLRWSHGDLQFKQDSRLGRWAAAGAERLQSDLCYTFTQVGLEILRWAKRSGIPTVLESPNGYIRNFREVYEQESLRWCGKKYGGHPNQMMVERVEKEYLLADRIRVSSEWSKLSIAAGGIPSEKIYVLEQPVNLTRFHPTEECKKQDGPLRVCFVGSLDLRKGFVYLLRAIKKVGASRIALEIAGATGDRCCRNLFARESEAVNFKCDPGDPVPVYHHAELFVLPTLEDGSPFAVAEAMACGLPVVVTGNCGAAEWVRPGETGWIIPAADDQALALALEEALDRRKDLCSMGRSARADVERRAGPACFNAFRNWLSNEEQHTNG
jgi:glycosyltransferase involved in cell wall biosynthesis